MPRGKKTTKATEIAVTPVIEITDAPAFDMVPASVKEPKLKSRKMSFKKLSATDLDLAPQLEPVPQQELSRIQLEPQTPAEISVVAVEATPADNNIDSNQVEAVPSTELLNKSGLSSSKASKAKGIKHGPVLEFSMDLKEYLARQEKVMEEMTVMTRHIYNHTKRSQALGKMRITFFIILGIIFTLIGSVFAPTFKKAFVQYNSVLQLGGGGVKGDTFETVFDKPK